MTVLIDAGLLVRVLLGVAAFGLLCGIVWTLAGLLHFHPLF